jgi:outer membrane murein-binding lipoprotein Lpp
MSVERMDVLERLQERNERLVEQTSHQLQELTRQVAVLATHVDLLQKTLATRASKDESISIAMEKVNTLRESVAKLETAQDQLRNDVKTIHSWVMRGTGALAVLIVVIQVVLKNVSVVGS